MFKIEPEVHIIEKYFQEVLHCFTMTNIRCKGGKEIDLLAINPYTNEKFHVEARVGTSKGFAIRIKDTYTSSGRPHKIGLDYFAKQKFQHPIVITTVTNLLFGSNYKKILVVWDVANKSVIEEAKNEYGIEIWLMKNLLMQLLEFHSIRPKGSRDDILRTIEFMALGLKVKYRKPKEKGKL